MRKFMTISNSFIELYNPTAESVDLNGYTLSFDDTKTLTLSNVTLESGKSWLVVGKAETITDDLLTYDLPEADQAWDIAIDNKNYTLTMKDEAGEEVDVATADQKNDLLKISKQKSLRRIEYQDTDMPSDWQLIVWEKASVDVNETYVQSYAPHNSKGEYGSVHVAATEPAEPEQPSYTPVVTSDAKITGFNNGSADLNMELIARYNSGAMNADGGSMEIVEYNSKNGYSYSVSGLKGQIIASKISGLLPSDNVVELPGTEYDVKKLVESAGASNGFTYGDITSVAFSPDGTKLAAAVQHKDYDKAGKIAIFTCKDNGDLKNPILYDAGVQPDMVTFADDNTVLTADEGEPREGYGEGATDPMGTVTILNLTNETSKQVGFGDFSADALIAKNILIGKTSPETTLTPETDLEPEYIAVSSDGKTAYVSLQEANAIAVLDIVKQKFTGIYSVGFEDYSQVAVDIVKSDKKYEAKKYEYLMGARMPDGIAVYENARKTYLLTANEGDSRDWNGYCNEGTSSAFSDVVVIDESKCAGLPAGKTVLFGGRSFSVFEVTGNGLKEVYDSGNEFEKM